LKVSAKMSKLLCNVLKISGGGKCPKSIHHYVRVIYNYKIRLRRGLVEYGQLSIEGDGVQLDWLAHTLVCKIEFC